MNDADDMILNDYRGWLRATASRLMSDPALIDDLAQEGWIAMWRALRDYRPEKGALPAWLTQHAMWRMLDCARDKAWLGRPPRNMGSSKVRDVAEYAAADDATVWDRIQSVDVADDLLIAYHRGEIADAVTHLTPQQRRYVYLRFWRGYQRPDMVAEFGYDPTALWNSARNGAKLKLRESLAHLAGVS